MESKHKNALIVALLAVVLVMAVGYAAFAQQLTAQQLTINSTATINQGDEDNPNWKVEFDQDKTTGVGVVDTTTGSGGTVPPTGSISFSDGSNANISATLNTPGDSVKFTFTVVNYGTIKAALGTPVLSLTSGEDQDGEPGGSTVKYNNVIFTVTNPISSTLEGGTDASTTFTVTATFDPNATSVASGSNSAGITVSLSATQSA